MKINNIYKSSCSAVFEIENDLCYFNDANYRVLVNGEDAGKEYNTNVFSLFGLQPDTEYSVKTSLMNDEIKFRTKNESCSLNVREFGAKGDGKTDDTKAIQGAINVCPKYGRIYIPEGVYLVTPIALKSHITIEIKKNAVLIGSTEEDDYFVLPGEVGSKSGKKGTEVVSWEGRPAVSHQSLLSAYHSEDIHIVGEGIIDGNAHNSTWWNDVKSRQIARPKLFFTNRCSKIYIHGVGFKNSPCWHIHPYNSKNIGIYDIKVEAPKDSPNTDGCNPESCNMVEIIGAHFSVGDDAIAIKSGKLYDGKTKNIPAKNHIIRNCLMEFAHGAVVLGSEMSGGIRNLSVTRCLFKNTDRGLRIKTRRGRGRNAIVDNVSFNNIKMDGVLTPLVINMFYFCDPDGKTEYVQSKNKMKVDRRTPYLGKFHFADMECINCSVAAGFFYGLPEQPIKEVFIENVIFEFSQESVNGHPAMMLGFDECSKMGLYFNNVENVRLHEVTLKGYEGDRVLLEGVKSYAENKDAY